MIVRSYLPKDKAATIALWERCGLTKPWNDPSKDIDRKVSDGADLFLVGEQDGELIAVVMGGYDGHRGWLNYLAVTPNERGNGYAARLIRVLEQQLVDLGCPKLNLQIRDSNVDVRRFYESLGYTKDACISMGKRLIKD